MCLFEQFAHRRMKHMQLQGTLYFPCIFVSSIIKAVSTINVNPMLLGFLFSAFEIVFASYIFMKLDTTVEPVERILLLTAILCTFPSLNHGTVYSQH